MAQAPTFLLTSSLHLVALLDLKGEEEEEKSNLAAKMPNRCPLMPAAAFLYTKPCNQQLQRLQMALNGAELFRFFRVLCPVFFFFLFVVRSWWPPPPPPPMHRRQPFVVFHTLYRGIIDHTLRS